MTGRRRVLLVFSKSGYETDDFVAAADRLDIDLIAASDRCRQLEAYWPDEVIPVQFHAPESSVRNLIARLGPRRPDGVVAIGDRAVVITSLVARELGLASNSPQAARASRDKLESRTLLAGTSAAVPRFESVALDEDPRPAAARLGYPCVIKPRRLSASRGVIRADDANGLVEAFSRVRHLLDELEVRRLHGEDANTLILEEFIEGPEIAIEGIMNDGDLQILAVFDKPDPLDGPFFAETIYVTPSECPETILINVYDTVRSACTTLGLTHGPIHAEIRLSEAGPVVLEVAGRSIGGLCSRTLRFGAGVSLEEVILRQAAGFEQDPLPREASASGVMMLPVPQAGIYRDCGGVREARAVTGVEGVEITVRPGQRVRPLPEGDAYLGFIFARGEKPQQVVDSLRSATAMLRVTISPGLPLEGDS